MPAAHPVRRCHPTAGTAGESHFCRAGERQTGADPTTAIGCAQRADASRTAHQHGAQSAGCAANHFRSHPAVNAARRASGHFLPPRTNRRFLFCGHQPPRRNHRRPALPRRRNRTVSAHIPARTHSRMAHGRRHTRPHHRPIDCQRHIAGRTGYHQRPPARFSGRASSGIAYAHQPSRHRHAKRKTIRRIAATG